MTIEEEIILWAKDRPAWQRAVLRRAALGMPFDTPYYDELARQLCDQADLEADAEFTIEIAQTGSPNERSVRVAAISDIRHVNALTPGVELTFETAGITVVYGDNGSGKSGFARLLKRATKARHEEEILSDVFTDDASSRPRAKLSLLVGDGRHEVAVPDQLSDEAARVHFYDSACGAVYVTDDLEFPYRPAAFRWMDQLVATCDAVRARIDSRLAASATALGGIPTPPDSAQNSDIGHFLVTLSAESAIDRLDELLAKYDTSSAAIENTTAEENRLRSLDPTQERHRLGRNAAKLGRVAEHLDQLSKALGFDALAQIESARVRQRDLVEARAINARSLSSAPLTGTGSSAWRELWASARRFSEKHAYPSIAFPASGDGCCCVLCQQQLNEHARSRFTTFEKFVNDDIVVRAKEAERNFKDLVAQVAAAEAAPSWLQSELDDLAVSHALLSERVRGVLAAYGEVQRDALAFANGDSDALPNAPSLTALADEIAGAVAKSLGDAECLSDPAAIQKMIRTAASTRTTLEFVAQMKVARETIVREVERLKLRRKLETVNKDTSTRPISQKLSELSESGITQLVRDRFESEVGRLRLERVGISKTRVAKGSLLLKPQLVGVRQTAPVRRVFSEGERTVLGLAAFLTEVELDQSGSAVIFDDPVTSLDHVRRARVAARLAELAQSRQVVVFTHDVAFVADLKREAGAEGVSVAERAVSRSRTAERKPGTCAAVHPWKVKDVPARINELRQELDRMRKAVATWDDRQYGDAVAIWAGNLSETWERIFSQEIVGAVLAEGGLEVRPKMVKVLARFSDEDHREFDGSYSRISQWAKRHDKSAAVNYVDPDIAVLDEELCLVEKWFKRVKRYSA